MEQPRPHRKNIDKNGMRTMNSLFQLRRCQLNAIYWSDDRSEKAFSERPPPLNTILPVYLVN